MRTIKLVGLAVVGILALAALFGASSASASHLCKKNTNSCKEENRWPVGTEFTAQSTESVHFSYGEVCSKSEINAKLSNAGGGIGVPIEFEVTKMTFSGCAFEVYSSLWTTINPGSLKVVAGGPELGDGILTGEGQELKREKFANGITVTCRFAGWVREGEKESNNAILHGGATPYLTVQNTLMPTISGPCSGVHTESARYEVSSPSPMYVTFE